MNPAISRCATLVLAVFLLCGCSGLRQINIPVTGNARAFTEGFDSYMSNGDTSLLKELPPGEWQTRAKQLLTLGSEQKSGQAQVKKLQKQLQEQEQKITEQQQKIEKLESTLKQLKEVLIHNELQPK